MNKIINMYFATHRTCNLNCRYCYIPPYNKHEKKNKDELIILALESFVSKVESEDYRIGAFCLHGAEPSLLSPEALSEAVNMIGNHKQKYGAAPGVVAIQTNGVRVDDAYLDIIEKETGGVGRLRIGFSIDPPAIIHDMFRDNSFTRVEKNYENAIERGFPVSILSVVTSETMKYLPDFRDWMRKQLDRMRESGNPYKVKIKFATGEFAPEERQLKDFALFLLENDMARLVQILSQGYCLQHGNECMWFEFDVDGNCYSCNKAYMNEGVFANWQNESFDYIFRKRMELYANVPEHSDCNVCSYEYVCNSGCPADRHLQGKWPVKHMNARS